MTLTVLMLAAGRSRRFGAADKLMAPLGGRPLIAHAVAAQAGLPGDLVAERVAVVGPCCPAAGLLTAAGFRLVVNERPDEGQGRSLALGAAAWSSDRLLILLADMPLVTPDLLIRLAGCRARAAASDGRRPSPPALFPRADRPALLAADGDRGARDLLAGAATVPARPGELRDVDTPEALAEAVARQGALP